MPLSRRSVLKATLSAVPTYYVGGLLSQFLPTLALATAPGTATAMALPTVTVRAVDATYVRLLPGTPFQDRQELHRKTVLARYEPDRLLFHYRALAALPQAEGVRGGYGGWESGFLRGHMAGHYLSAASRMAVATGDNAFRDRVTYMIAELAKCQEALKLDGYLAAFPAAAFDPMEGRRGGNTGGVVVPYYTVQKIMSGLLDAHHYLANTRALQVAEKMAAYFEKRLAGLSEQQIERAFRTDDNRNPQNEFGAMSDALVDLSTATKDPKHLDAASLFNRPWFIDPLVNGEDRLAGLHANTHIAQAIGLASTANTTGEAKAAKASENFWKIVVQKRSFVNGGNSVKEWFDKAGVEVGPSIDGNVELPATTCETCNSHNMLKLTARLFERTPAALYGDYYERALYNHVLASVAPDTGEMTYFTPLRGQFRTYMNGTFCCTGSGIENTPRYNEGIYFGDRNVLYVNLYVPSELDWRQASMTLRQEGDITRGEAVRFTIAKAGTTPAELKFRIPHWIARPASVSVNGSPIESAGKGSTFVSVKRTWKAGDVVTVSLPAALRIERAKDDPSVVAIFFGPLLLAGALGRDGMPDDFADKDAHLRVPPAAVPDIVSASTNPGDWLKPLPGEPSTFTAGDVGSASGIIFRPVYDVHHQRYSAYWRLQPA